MLDDGAVGMILPPGAGFAINAGFRMNRFQPFDELVFDGRVTEDGFHLAAEFRGHQPAGLQQIIETGYLEGGGAMGKVVKGIPLPRAGFAVFLADPKAAVSPGIIESITGGLQQIGQISLAYLIEDFRSGVIG